MIMGQTPSYGGEDTDANFCVPSTIDFPDMKLSDPNPNGTLDSITDCTYAGWGSGGETIHPDGSVTTRYKAESSYGGGPGGGIDGGDA